MSTKTTFAELVDQFGTAATEFVGEFAADLDIPIITGLPQAQGDVLVCPPTMLGPDRRVTIRNLNSGIPVTNDGIEVIRGGAMNNAHTLRTLDKGVVWYADVIDSAGLALGVVRIPEGAVCFLEHSEHGFSGIGAGTYVVGRQREQAEAVRLVAD